MRTLARLFLASRNGNFATMTALVSPVLIVVAAIGVDLGSFFLERREAQNLTDLAALSAARAPQQAEQAAFAAFADNGFADISLMGGRMSLDDDDDETPQNQADHTDRMHVTIGAYQPDPTVAAKLRFVAGLEPANAVRVEFERPAKQFFSQSLIDAPTIRTSAVASMVPKASFSIGSRLARLEGGIANELLTRLLGTDISLSVMDYDALVDAEIGVLAFAEQVGLQAGITAGTYSDALDGDVALRHVLRAVSLTPGVGLTARTALQRLATAVPATRMVPLAKLLDPGVLADARIGSVAADLDTAIGAFPLLSAAAALANGQNQVALDLGGSIPGLLDLTATVAIGEPPQSASWFAYGPTGAIVRTAQTRIRLDARVGPVLGVGVHVPLFVDVAYGEAKLIGAACPTGLKASAQASVEARPGIVELYLADADISRMHDFSRKPHLSQAALLRAPLIRVDAYAHAAATNLSADTLDFAASDIVAKTIKTVSTRNTLETLSRSLLSDLELEPRVLGIGLGGLLSPVLNELGDLVGSTLGLLDPVLNALLGALGISLGEADIRVHAVDCGRPVLVQ